MPSSPASPLPGHATLAILAGGAGSRMGAAKGLLTLGDRPILDYLLDHLAWPGPTMLVTAPDREHPPGWRRFTRELSDPISNGGPLRGILTALERLDTPLLLVLTVDMPGIRPPQCMWAIDALLKNPDSIGVMMQRGVQGATCLEPFPCALRRDALAIVSKRFAEGKRSVHRLLDEPGFAAVDSPAEWRPTTWTNLNVPDDLRNFQP